MENKEKLKNGYQPNYDSKCDNCGQSPVVTIIENGVTVYDFEMCGVCTFGETKCIDPGEW